MIIFFALLSAHALILGLIFALCPPGVCGGVASYLNRKSSDLALALLHNLTERSSQVCKLPLAAVGCIQFAYLAELRKAWQPCSPGGGRSPASKL